MSPVGAATNATAVREAGDRDQSADDQPPACAAAWRVCSYRGGNVARALSQLACCIGGAAFRCCCSCCPSSTNSSAVRTGYILVMSVYILIAWIMMGQNIGSKLGEMADETGEVGKGDYTVETGVDCEGFNSSCDKRWSQLAAYRVLFGPVCFHLAMCIFTVGVQSSRDCRAGLHNGFWGVKILVITGAIVGAFFIKNTFFEDYWGYFGLVGAALFLLLQSWSFVTFSLNLSAFYKDDEGQYPRAVKLNHIDRSERGPFPWVRWLTYACRGPACVCACLRRSHRRRLGCRAPPTLT